MTHSVETVENWLDRIFSHERGYSDNPNDPGNWTGGRVQRGELKGTKWGIAANTYGDLDIKNLTVEDAAKIYIRDFLEPLRADQFEDGVAFQLLDFAVNSGPLQAKKALQRAVGVKDDGIIGMATLDAISKLTESDLIMRVLAERLEYATSVSGWSDFGRGWARRIAANLRYGAADA